jgi:molecular chaperone GrpE
MNEKDTNKDDITIDDSEFAPTKKAKPANDEPSDVVGTFDEDSKELSPEIFKKLKDKLTLALKEKQEYLDGWQRAKADYQNLKKQSEKERSETIKFANERLIEEFLVVLGSFNMAFANKEAWNKVESGWRTGVEYIYWQLKNVLENNGLKEENPVGAVFDPMKHEATAQIETTDDSQVGKIASIVAKGYSLNDKQLIAPKVTVFEKKA